MFIFPENSIIIVIMRKIIILVVSTVFADSSSVFIPLWIIAIPMMKNSALQFQAVPPNICARLSPPPIMYAISAPYIPIIIDAPIRCFPIFPRYCSA